MDISNADTGVHRIGGPLGLSTPQRFDECWVDDERVVGNDGSFYGGWITNNVTGPFKGGPGTLHW